MRRLPKAMVKSTIPNDGDCAAILSARIPDAATRKQVLVDNPARLYGFK
jgi:2-pyrone-4,6-dicarboxylate lactonase